MKQFVILSVYLKKEEPLSSSSKIRILNSYPEPKCFRFLRVNYLSILSNEFTNYEFVKFPVFYTEFRHIEIIPPFFFDQRTGLANASTPSSRCKKSQSRELGLISKSFLHRMFSLGSFFSLCLYSVCQRYYINLNEKMFYNINSVKFINIAHNGSQVYLVAD